MSDTTHNREEPSSSDNVTDLRNAVRRAEQLLADAIASLQRKRARIVAAKEELDHLREVNHHTTDVLVQVRTMCTGGLPLIRKKRIALLLAQRGKKRSPPPILRRRKRQLPH